MLLASQLENSQLSFRVRVQFVFFVHMTEEPSAEEETRGTSPFPVVFPVHFLKLYHSHSEAVRLLVMAARQGVKDEQIADALRNGFPNLADPDYLQDVSASQHFEEKTGENQDDEQLNSVYAAQKELSWRLNADTFAEALSAIPANDWWRTWAADKTMMLTMTSKQIKVAVDKLRPPTIVKVNKTFLDNVVCCKRERLQQILTQLEKMVSRCRITILDLEGCGMSEQDAERLAGVLEQCPALSHLYLRGNQIGAEGVGRLAGVLPQCPSLSELGLGGNQIGAEGVERLVGVLPQVLNLLALLVQKYKY